MKNVLCSVIFNIILVNVVFAQSEINLIAEPNMQDEYVETRDVFTDLVDEKLPKEHREGMPDHTGIRFRDKHSYTPPMVRFLSQLPFEEKIRIKTIVQKYQLQMKKLEWDMRPTIQMLQNSIDMYRLNLTRLTILPETRALTDINVVIDKVFTNGRDHQGNLVDLRKFSDFYTAASKTNIVKSKESLGQIDAASMLVEITNKEQQLAHLQSLYDQLYQTTRKEMHKEIMDVVNVWIAKNSFMTKESLEELFSEAENQYGLPNTYPNTVSMSF